MLPGSPVLVENFYRAEIPIDYETTTTTRTSNQFYHHNHDLRTSRYKQQSSKQQQQQQPPKVMSGSMGAPPVTSDGAPILAMDNTNSSSSSKASNFKTTAMSAFNTNHRDGEYPIINVEAENEHFAASDSIISWLETCKATTTMIPNPVNSSHSQVAGDDTQPRNDAVINESDTTTTKLMEGKQPQPSRVINLGNLNELGRTLPPPSANHQLSAPGMAWSIIRKVAQDRGAQAQLLEAIPQASELFHFQDPVGGGGLGGVDDDDLYIRCKSPDRLIQYSNNSDTTGDEQTNELGTSPVRMRGNDEWAPPRAQIIFNIHEESNFRKLMLKQNYRCAGCGTKIDLDLARRLVLYCHYLGKYFCKCCFSHKSIHLPGYILQKWDFHKYSISHFALQLLDRIANEPLFNINDINPSLYRKVKKLRHLIDIRMQLYYLKIYISTCTQTEKLDQEYASFTHQHLIQDDVHLYSLNNLIEIQHGKLYEYLSDLVSRSIAHIAKCDRCRAKGHYCQLCGPSSLISSIILSEKHPSQESTSSISAQQAQQQQQRLKHSSSAGQNISQLVSAASGWGRKSPIEPSGGGGGGGSSNHSRSSSGNFGHFVSSAQPTATTTTSHQQQPQTLPVPSSNVNDHELIFPFEIGRVAQCRACGCCFHQQCFVDAGQNCPKCERIQRRNAEIQDNSTTDTSGLETSKLGTTTTTTSTTT